MAGKSSEFVLKLEGIKLSAEAEQRIEKGIQSVVLQEIVGYKPNPEDSGKPIKIPGHPHYGFVIAPLKWAGGLIKILNMADIKKLEVNTAMEIKG